MTVTVCDHPLARHKLGLLRDASISSRDFRRITAELSLLLAVEATRDLPLEQHRVEGWAGSVSVQRIAGKKLTVVPILRAGLGMLDGVLDLIPSARVSVLGMYRDEATLQAVPYYAHLNADIAQRWALVVDPMLATAGSMIAAIDQLKAKGCQSIRAMVMLAAPEGIAALQAAHPDVPLYTAAIDSHLDEQGYIVPGLGDAGDRIFATQLRATPTTEGQP